MDGVAEQAALDIAWSRHSLAAFLAPSSFSTISTELSHCAFLLSAKEPVMSRLAILFVSALSVTSATAQDTASGRSHEPAAASAYETQPFLFDGRMRGDGMRQRGRADNRHPNVGAIDVQPKANEPGRER